MKVITINGATMSHSLNPSLRMSPRAGLPPPGRFFLRAVLPAGTDVLNEGTSSKTGNRVVAHTVRRYEGLGGVYGVCVAAHSVRHNGV